MPDSIWTKLAAPLDPRVIKTREQAGKTLRYIDSRTVTDILDRHALGEWTVKVTPLPVRDEINRKTGEVIGPVYTMLASLTVNGITREDVGEGDDYKSATSDALKRAAVRFGIGRELYGEKPGDTAPTITTKAVLAEHPAAPLSRPTPVPRPTAPKVALQAPETLAGAFPPPCPKCQGKMWDNREGKKNPKAPDAKCRDKTCDGVIWPPKPGQKPVVLTAAETDEEYLARVAAELDATEIPF